MPADKILLVEDSKEDSVLIKVHLNNGGFENIIDVDNASSALELLKNEYFDLIIADRYMPGMTGLDFFKTIKNDKNLEHIPFLMITAEHRSEKILETMALGIRDYIIKPFDPDILVKKVRRMLADSKL